VLINRLLTAYGRRDFKARQIPEANNVTSAYSVDLKSVEPVQKHENKCEQRIIPDLNDIILLKLRHEWHTTISIWARRKLKRGRWFKMAQKLTLRRNYNPRYSIARQCDVRAFSFSFPPSNLTSGAAVTAAPPVFWIISLYLWYQVYFVIIIVEFLVTVLSITYYFFSFWGWTVTLNTNWQVFEALWYISVPNIATISPKKIPSVYMWKKKNTIKTT